MKTTNDRKASTPTHFSTTDLNELRQQLNGWRRSKPPRSRIPEQVWKSAATLARSHGVSKVAGALRLDYYKVRQHLTGSGTPASAAGFVEVPWPSPSPTIANNCTVELLGARGGRMIVHLPGDTRAVMVLAEAFWKRQR